MTKAYEALIIIKTVANEQELAQAVARLEEPIKKFGGTVTLSTNLGRRRLAFKIGASVEGYYQSIYFELSPTELNELKRAWRLNDQVVRSLLLQSDGVPEQPPKSPATAEVSYGQSQSHFSHR